MSGPALLGLQLPESPQRWSDLGFTVIDDVCQVGDVTVTFGEPGWTLHGSGPATVDGIPTRWTTTGPAPAQTHPVGALSVDHVVVMTDDLQRTREAFAHAGMRVRREREIGERKQLFIRHGEAIVEVVGPTGEGTSLWGLTVTVADLDAVAEASAIRGAVQPGRRIAPLRGLSVPLALMSQPT